MPPETATLPSRAASARANFLTRTYLHVLGAILALVAFDAWLFASGIADRLAEAMRPIPWPVIFSAFVILAWLATRLAWRLHSLAAQYSGLGLYLLAKGLILVPLLYHAERRVPGVVREAAYLTVLATLGLTAVAWRVRTDFSGLRPYLYWGGAVALVLIVASWIFGWHLGTWFSVGMIALAGCSILYDTAKIRRQRYGNRHVGAALTLVASIGTMFWYILRYTSRLTRR